MTEPKEEGPTPDFVYKFPHANEFPELQKMALTSCSLLLASSSQCRKTLFASAAIPFGSVCAPLDEEDVQDWLEAQSPPVPADRRTTLIAQLKANAAVQALKGPNFQHLQQLRLINQVLNLPEAERPRILEKAEKEARESGRPIAAVAQLASFTKTCGAMEAADGRYPVLVTVDTGVELDGQVRFKPKDKEEAARFLKSYSDSDSPIIVTTSVVLVDLCNELVCPSWDPNAAVPAEKGFSYMCRACKKPQRSDLPDRQDKDPDSCSCPFTVVHAAHVLTQPGGPAQYHCLSRETIAVRSEVKFNQMDEEARRRIIEEGEVMYSAGAVIVEKGEMSKYLHNIAGCGHNVMGVPLGDLAAPLNRLLQKTANQ